MSAPLVSCIIPAFNAEQFVSEAIDSIARQTYASIEIIVIDDGSTDGTQKVVEQHPATVRYVRKENGGGASARNLGVNAAGGEFLAFLDADDLWRPDKIARQFERFRDRPLLGVSVTCMSTFRGSPMEAGTDAASEVIPAYSMSTMMARRIAFERVGLFDEALRHADDTEWFLRVRGAGMEMELLNDVLAYRRLHAENLSLTGRSASIDEYLHLLKKNLDRRRAGPSGLVR
ncbi:MAG: glycosyltransferase family A protein [Vicinamibacterales bacterium]